MTTKSSKVKRRDDLVEFSNEEICLLLEALKNQAKKVEEERFYRNVHPRGFYDIYLERYWKLIGRLDRKLPKAVFIKMPRF